MTKLYVNIFDILKLQRYAKKAIKSNKAWFIAPAYPASPDYFRFITDEKLTEYRLRGDEDGPVNINLCKQIKDVIQQIVKSKHKFVSFTSQNEKGEMLYCLCDLVDLYRDLDYLEDLLKEFGHREDLRRLPNRVRSDIAELLKQACIYEEGEAMARSAWKKHVPDWTFPELLIQKQKKRQIKKEYAIRRSNFKSFADVRFTRR
ncbi:hypothetical protein ACQKLP_10655 [Chitinophaga sp. NPDC101104]|uniref:hypothetical protein n=1 Tax=Chitinophaga sp. NPDC101104 TaxID=3390561 RepID=UPI003D00AA01